MSKEMIKNLIELVPEDEIELLYRIIVKFIPEVEAEDGEVEALYEGRLDREKNGTIKHEDIDWDI